MDCCERREDIFDPNWEKQQIKAFTAWCNAQLRKVNLRITKLDTDFTDGHLLLKLLEVISNESLPLAETKSMRFHKIANVNQALSFIESKGVRLVSIGAEEIVDGNIKMTLGMIWTIILRFAIQDITVDNSSAREGLLLWCQRKTEGYEGVHVANFHSSFKDGKAFAALIHKHRPDLVDFGNFFGDSTVDNLHRIFNVAEHQLDIPPMLDAEDLAGAGRSDEQSVMAYVSSYYHRFTSEEWARKASNLVCDLLRNRLERGEAAQYFNDLSADLLAWVELKTAWLADRPYIEDLADCLAQIDQLSDFSTREKPERYRQKVELENNDGTLKGYDMEEIASRWRHMDCLHDEFRRWIYSLHSRLSFLDCFARTYFRKSANFERWLQELCGELPAVGDELTPGEVQFAEKKLEVVGETLGSESCEGKGEFLQDLREMAAHLEKSGYSEMGAVRERLSEVEDRLGSLVSCMAEKAEELSQRAEVLRTEDECRLRFALKVGRFKKWLDYVADDMGDIVLTRTEEEAARLLQEMEEFERTLPEAEGTLRELRECAGGEGVYLAVGLAEVEGTWRGMLERMAERRFRLEGELADRKRVAQLRGELETFCDQANLWVAETNRQLRDVREVGDLDTRLDMLRAMETRISCFRPTLSLGEETFEKMRAFWGVVEDGYSLERMRIELCTLAGVVSSQLDVLGIQRRNSLTEAASTEEMTRNFKSSFEHFDHDRDGRLDYVQLDACLVSLGYRLSQDSGARVASMLDTAGSGFIAIEDFMGFMMQREDGAHQLVESFRILSGGKAFITGESLRSHLPLRMARFCEEKMPPVEGGFDYTAFVEGIDL